ncbi:LamG-like jellyroll fold domain-containing protein [Spirillospora sp. CA-253888]
MTEQEAFAAAKRTGQPVEVLSMRGESREVFAQPGEGGLLLNQHLRPVRTLKAGKWVGVDATLARSSEGISPVASTVGLTLSPGGKAPLVKMTRAGRMMELSWPAALPAPELDGDTAVYKGVLGPDVDLHVQADIDGFSHALVVHTPEAAKDPRLTALQFGLSTPGLTMRVDAEGNQIAIDAVTGAEVFSAPAPAMWNSGSTEIPSPERQAPGAASGQGPGTEKAPAPDVADGSLRKASAESPGDLGQTAPVKVAVENGKLTLHPDLKLLTSPSTKFPVFIDPKYHAPKSTEDGTWLMVSSGGWKDWKFKGDEGMGRCPYSLPNGYKCEGSYVKRLLYSFPTSTLAGADVTKAEFVVKETYAPSCTKKKEVSLYRISGFTNTSTWNTLWDNKKYRLTGRTDAKGWNSSCPAGDLRFNITEEMGEVAKAKNRNISFYLRAGQGEELEGTDEESQYAWKRFSNEATLQVYYNHKPHRPTPAQLSSSPGGSCTDTQWGHEAHVNQVPTLKATNLTDPDNGGVEGEKLKARFGVHWTDAAGVAKDLYFDDDIPMKGTKKSSFSVELPKDKIPPSTLIGWDVQSYDGEAWSDWSSAGADTRCYFRYEPLALPAPTISSALPDGYAEVKPDAPEELPQNGVGRYGKFTIGFDARVTKYAYKLDTNPSAQEARPRQAGKPSEEIWVAPDRSGINRLVVQAWDAAGNWSRDQFLFSVSEGKSAKSYWKMNEAKGTETAADSGEHPEGQTGHPATFHGGTSLEEEGVSGSAVKLDGKTGYASTAGPVLDTTKSFTVMAWAKLDDKTHTSVVVGQDGTQGSSFALYYSPSYDRWVFNMQDPNTTDPALIRSISTAPPTLGQWTHLIGVYDQVAKKITLYVNGVAQGSTDQPNLYGATGALQIGRFKYKGGYGAGFYYAGSLDEVKVYDRVMHGLEAGTVWKVKSQVAGLWHLNSLKAGSTVLTEDSAPVPVKHDAALSATGAAITNDEEKVLVGPDEGPRGALDLTGGHAEVGALGLNTGESFAISAWLQTPGIAPTAPMTVLRLNGPGNPITLRYRYDQTSQKGQYVLDVNSGPSGSPTTGHLVSTAFHQGDMDSWDHVAVMFNGFDNTVTLRVNKERLELAGTRPVATTAGLQLGKAVSGDGPWRGQIDDVWLLRGAVNDGQIDRLANATELSDI